MWVVNQYLLQWVEMQEAGSPLTTFRYPGIREMEVSGLLNGPDQQSSQLSDFYIIFRWGDNHITAGTAWRGAIRIGKTKKLEAARAPKESDRSATDSEETSRIGRSRIGLEL